MLEVRIVVKHNLTFFMHYFSTRKVRRIKHCRTSVEYSNICQPKQMSFNLLYFSALRASRHISLFSVGA